jgi:hypothetical protein
MLTSPSEAGAPGIPCGAGRARFSLVGRPLVSDARSIRVHERLQARADAGFPVLSSSGAQLLVLSRKPL